MLKCRILPGAPGVRLSHLIAYISSLPCRTLYDYSRFRHPLEDEAAPYTMDIFFPCLVLRVHPCNSNILPAEYPSFRSLTLYECMAYQHVRVTRSIRTALLGSTTGDVIISQL